MRRASSFWLSLCKFWIPIHKYNVCKWDVQYTQCGGFYFIFILICVLGGEYALWFLYIFMYNVSGLLMCRWVYEKWNNVIQNILNKNI